MRPASTSTARSSLRSGFECGEIARITASRSTSRWISSRSGASIRAASRGSRSRSFPISAAWTTRAASGAISRRSCSRRSGARRRADRPLLLGGRAVRGGRLGGDELVLAPPVVHGLVETRDRRLLLLDLLPEAHRLVLRAAQLRELAQLLVGVALELRDELVLRLELAAEPLDLAAQSVDLGAGLRADLLDRLRGFQLFLERLYDRDLIFDALLELGDPIARGLELRLGERRRLMTRDRLLLFLDLRRQSVDAREQLVLLRLGLCLVLAQAVEAGLQGRIRLVLLANSLDQRLDQLLAPNHEALEVLGLAEPPTGFLVAFLGLGEAVFEPRDDLAPLVRDLAQVVRAFLLVAELLLEPRALLAGRLELGRELLAPLGGRRELHLDALELRGQLRDPGLALAEGFAQAVVLRPGGVGFASEPFLGFEPGARFALERFDPLQRLVETRLQARVLGSK